MSKYAFITDYECSIIVSLEICIHMVGLIGASCAIMSIYEILYVEASVSVRYRRPDQHSVS